MPDITFDCPRCGGHLVVNSQGAGTTVSCPLCEQSVLIPRNQSPEKVVIPHQAPATKRVTKALPTGHLLKPSQTNTVPHPITTERRPAANAVVPHRPVADTRFKKTIPIIGLVVFLTLLLVAGVSVFQYCQKLHVKNQTLLARLTDMESKMLALESQLGTAGSMRQSQVTLLADLEIKNRSLHQQVNDQEAANRSLNNRLQSMEGQNIALKEQLMTRAEKARTAADDQNRALLLQIKETTEKAADERRMERERAEAVAREKSLAPASEPAPSPKRGSISMMVADRFSNRIYVAVLTQMVPYTNNKGSFRESGEKRVEVGRIPIDMTGKAVFKELESGKYELYLLDENDRVYSRIPRIYLGDGDNASFTFRP